jgi:hypothetical protein
MKQCTSCKVLKELDQFYKDRQKKDHLSSRCKTCINEQVQKYTNENKEECKIRQNIASKKSYIKKHSYYTEYNKEYREVNKEYFEKWRGDNRESNREYAKQYFQNNKEKIKQKIKARRGNSIHLYKWRDLLNVTLKKLNQIKTKKTKDLLGYTSIQLKEHLDNQGMNWSFHQIDHKIPLSWFKEDTLPTIVNDLRNLHPLDPATNQSKSNRYMHSVDSEYLVLVRDYIKEEYVLKLII